MPSRIFFENIFSVFLKTSAGSFSKLFVYIVIYHNIENADTNNDKNAKNKR